jgi:two-component system cell cycle sensor histidine kinase/response regulator CckA
MSSEPAGGGADEARPVDSRSETEARLRVVVQGMPVMMDAFDERRLITMWNAECERVTGFKAEEVVGNPEALALMYPDAEYRARMIEEWTVRGDDYRNWTWEITCKDGTKRMIEWSNVSKNLPIPGWTTWGIGVDVTDRLKLEAKLRQSQKMDAIGQLAGGVAHDFNNLLTVIRGCSQEVLDALPIGASALRSAVETIADAGERASLLTRQLLLFSRRATLRSETIDVNDMVRRCTRLLARLIGVDVRLHLDLAAGVHSVQADAGQIEQVVINLCLNARDAMRTGGELVIGTQEVEIRAEDLASRPEARVGRFVEIRVTDTGVGMSDDVKAHLFEPFFTTKEVGTGTGLGLATVFGIVQETAGFLAVESSPGKGTTMRVFLPAVAASARTDAPAGPPPIVRGTETILVVEDDAAVRRLVVRQLTAAGYHVLAAAGGDEAVRLVEAEASPVDLLVTDLVMPGMNGQQTAAALRQRRPALRVVFTSGYSAATWSRDAGDLGDDVLQKPFTMADLLGAVRHTLDRA